jgi:hypothetical protein
MTTLNGWKQSVAAGVVESVPLQDFESALILADDFLATQGGWNPDDPADPTGAGEPVTGLSTAEGIVAVTAQQIDRIYHVAITGVLNFRIDVSKNLTSGLDDTAVLASLVDRIDDVLQSNLRGTNISFVDVPSYTGDVTNGPTTATERQSIQNLITAGGQIINAKAIGLNTARAEYNLDNTHNVEYLYAEPGKSLFVMIQKYTTNLYQTLDATALNRYGIYLDPISYRTAGGIILSPE